jgi:hypothetical protein
MEKSVDERLKEIETLIDYYEAVINKKDETWNNSKPFEEYWKHVQQPERNKIYKLDREKRMIMPYELHEIPSYGDVMSLKDFIECVNDGGFIDYDGHGYYVKDDKESNIMIVPSDVKYNSVRKDFDTIVWFNR